VLLAAFGARVTPRSILTVPPARLNGGRLAGPSGHFNATPSRVLGAAVVASEGLSWAFGADCMRTITYSII
jgi:hypothetical protein